MLVALLADTHLPRGRRALPDGCRRRLDACELIVHAGDVIEPWVLEDLARYAPVAAVHGNVDVPALAAELPETRELDLDGVRLGVIHDAGAARGRLERLRARFPGSDAVVFGHSHIPLQEHDPRTGFAIFNPGSPTDRRRQPSHTMGLARVADGRIAFELVNLD